MRRFVKQREENQRTSWMTRTLATFVAAGYMTSGENPALKEAAQLAYDDIERSLLQVGEQAPEKPKDNANGSFEKFMTMLGGSGGRKG